MLVNELISSLVQVLVFALIPFVVHLSGSRTPAGFLRSIGLYRPEGRTVGYAVLSSVVLVPIMWGAFFAAGSVELLYAEGTVAGMLRAAGFSLETVLSLLVIAWIKTSLSEEILFRGFLGRLLIRRFGFSAGNLLQAAVFGLVHGLILALVSANQASGGFIALLIFLSSAAGFILGWIKETLGNGSLVPGWIAHGLGNTIGYTVIAFVL